VLSGLLCDAAAVYDHPSVTFAAQDIDQLTYAMQAAEAAVRAIAVTTESQRHELPQSKSAVEARYAAYTYAINLVAAATTFVGADASPAHLLDASTYSVQQPRLQMVQQLVSLRATSNKLDLFRLKAGVWGVVVEPKAFSRMWLLGDAERVVYEFNIHTTRCGALELAGQLLGNWRGPVLPHGMLLVRHEACDEQQQQQCPTGSAAVSCGQESPQLAQAQHQVLCNALIHAARLLHTMGEQLHAASSRPDAQTAYPWQGLVMISQLMQLTNARLVDGKVVVRSRGSADSSDAQSPPTGWLDCLGCGFFEAQQRIAAAASSSSGGSCSPARAGNPSGTPASTSSSSCTAAAAAAHNSTDVGSKGSRHGQDVGMKAASGKSSSSSHRDGSVSPKSLTPAGPDDLRHVVTGSTSGWQQGSQSSMMAGSGQKKPNRGGVTAVLHSSCHQAGSALCAEGLAAAAEVVAGRLFPAATAVKQKVEDWVEEPNGEYAGQQRASSSPPFAEVELLAAALRAAAQAMFAAVPNRYGCNNPALHQPDHCQ